MPAGPAGKKFGDEASYQDRMGMFSGMGGMGGLSGYGMYVRVRALCVVLNNNAPTVLPEALIGCCSRPAGACVRACAC